jgi:class 3 adenylate cyclase
MKKYSVASNRFSLLKSDLFWIIVFLCLGLAGLDYYNFTKLGEFVVAIHSLVAVLVLLVSALLVEENYFFWAIIILFPNTAFMFYLSLGSGSFKPFMWGFLTEMIIVLMMTLFQWRLHKSFISEEAFGKMKTELRDHKDNSLSRILYFSLIGCLRDRNKIISQAYHVLETCFKADSAMLFLADHENNVLVPSPKRGDRFAKNIQPIMVSPDFWEKAAYDPEKGVLNVINGQATLPSLRELIPQANLDALAAMPVSSGNRVIGLMAVIRQKPENRHYLEPSLFVTFAYILGSSLENCAVHEFRKKMLDSAEKKSEMIRNAFGKYVSDSIVDELINNREMAGLGGKKKKVSILMADLRGFTALASVMPIEQLVPILNSWFEIATHLILRSNGTIDKYMGDCVMVIFGAPIEKADDVLRSVYTAFRLQEKFTEFRKTIELPEGYDLGLGISISTGTAIVGNFGSSNRMEYTAIGETVNLAARLEKLAGAGEIVVNENTFGQIPQHKFRYETESNVPIKGIANQTVYRLKEVLRSQRN